MFDIFHLKRAKLLDLRIDFHHHVKAELGEFIGYFRGRFVDQVLHRAQATGMELRIISLDAAVRAFAVRSLKIRERVEKHDRKARSLCLD